MITKQKCRKKFNISTLIQACNSIMEELQRQHCPPGVQMDTLWDNVVFLVLSMDYDNLL